jgi:hypothetical protein
MNTANNNMIPNSFIGQISRVLSDGLSHAMIDSLFMSIGVEGESPSGNKIQKSTEYFKALNHQQSDSSRNEKLTIFLSTV